MALTRSARKTAATSSSAPKCDPVTPSALESGDPDINLFVLDGEEPIFLKVHHESQGVVLVKTARTLTLEHLMRHYSIHVGVAYEQAQYFYNGICLDAKATPADLGMTDQDTIEAVTDTTGERRGPKTKMGESSQGQVTTKTYYTIKISRSAGEGEDSEEERITLQVQSNESEDPTLVVIGKTTPLRNLMREFCIHKGYNSKHLKFLHEGKRLRPTDTAAKIGMEEDDIIDAMQDMIGGFGSDS